LNLRPYNEGIPSIWAYDRSTGEPTKLWGEYDVPTVQELEDTILGRTVQVEPMKPVLKPPGTLPLKLNHDKLLSSFAFNFNLRRYTSGASSNPPCRCGAASWARAHEVKRGLG